MPTHAVLDAEAVSLVTHPSGVQLYITEEYLYIHTRIRVSRSTQSGLCCIHSVLATAVVLVSLLEGVSAPPAQTMLRLLCTHILARTGRVCPPERALHEALANLGKSCAQ